MDKAHEQAKATRQSNLAAQTARMEEATAARRSARLALQRVTESPNATPSELLEAAKLLTELSQ